MKATILVVDDESPVRETVRAYLEKDGYTVYTAADGPTALQSIRAFKPDLVVLDIMLPGMDGLEVLRLMRQESNAWVIMLTARAEEMDKILGLKMGADDYLTKPFSPRELVARIEAMLRRSSQPGQKNGDVLIFEDLRIDADARKVWAAEQLISLTPIEFDLLLALARRQGKVLSREQLIEQVWGYDYFGDDRVVDVHIGRLRKKLDEAAGLGSRIATVRGIGYRFEDAP